ncbi:SGNH/GDSL hydrolase family protein [Nocardia uniformis]|uniref:SGNH/GDSL hydrolase family protein n=1 Tax=Nocardia uniformis TaxID=53432 RepID=A0A849CGI6_9NOCA|nr:SGNH/GDSL hydrolase family protein [Nocardia uniformis]NNH75777.1 SGNH/GDSL hydrolase family protein [Nocardia uniformis]
MRATGPRRIALLTAIAAALSITTVGAVPTESAPRFDKYVALGDSAAAVGSVDKLKPDSPRFCRRAEDNYPSVLAHTLGVTEFVDVSCSGAKPSNMTAPQYGMNGPPNPPQLDALTPDTDLVTITIGANDVGAFNVNVITDQQLDTMRARVGAILDDIHRRAPHATVVLTTYLRYLPPHGNCYGIIDHGGGQRLTDALREVAATHSARFADSYAKTGHDICQPPDTRWVNGPVPDTPTVPLHANLAGQEYLASVITIAVLD